MRITVFGAAGQIGRCVVNEALSRGHEVTAVVRNPQQVDTFPATAHVRLGDASRVDDVISISDGQALVINATRSAASDAHEVLVTMKALMDALAGSPVRLLVVGGAASLIVPGTNGRLVIDDARYLAPAARPIAEASLAQYRACVAETRVDWTYLSPPAHLTAGQRTGRYRLGRDHLLIDDTGHSSISIEDLAVALLDEAMHPEHHQSRFTAAY